MDSFIISLNAVLPMFILIIAGYYIKKSKLLNESAILKMNRVLFMFFLPILLFNNIYITDLYNTVRPSLMVFVGISIIVVWALSWMILIIQKNPAKRGVLIQGIFRSNFIVIGLPIVINLYSADMAGVTSFMAIIVIPLFNVLSSITLEVFRSNGEKSIASIIKNTCLNPLIISSLLSLIIIFIGITLPEFLEISIDYVANAAIPLALLIMGASLKISRINENVSSLLVATVGKLVIIPSITIAIAILVGFKGIELATVVAVFCSPTSVSSYPMVVNVEADSNLAAQIIVITTFFSSITIFMSIFLISTWNLL